MITEPEPAIVHFKTRASPASRASHCYPAICSIARWRLGRSVILDVGVAQLTAKFHIIKQPMKRVIRERHVSRWPLFGRPTRTYRPFKRTTNRCRRDLEIVVIWINKQEVFAGHCPNSYPIFSIDAIPAQMPKVFAFCYVEFTSMFFGPSHMCKPDNDQDNRVRPLRFVYSMMHSGHTAVHPFVMLRSIELSPNIGNCEVRQIGQFRLINKFH